MDLRDEVRSQMEKAHRLARKHYDAGDIARARAEYLKCARFTSHLADLSPRERKTELEERAKKFAAIAEGLKEGTVKVYTSGVKPPQATRPAAVKAGEERPEEKAKSWVLVEKPKTKYSDIAGLEEVKENIQEAIVDPFKYPEEYKYFGVTPGGGILMYGPPGCGKTTLARAAAAECDLPFINLKVSDIKDKYVGESERKLKEVFEVARSYSKSIIFFDEIDSLAGERSSFREAHDKSLVSELLAQMDGLEQKDGVLLVLAATNRPWDVDMALRRPGRFDSTVFVPHPDFEARMQLLKLKLKEKPLTPQVNLDVLANKMSGYASAEIVDVCQRAARIPLRERIRENRPRRQITVADFEKVIEKYKPMLPAWYAKAVKELASSEEASAFRDLIEAAKEFSRKSGGG